MFFVCFSFLHFFFGFRCFLELLTEGVISKIPSRTRTKRAKTVDGGWFFFGVF